MASLILGVAFASFAPVGFAGLGFSIGSLLGQALFPPKLPGISVEGPRLGDLKVSTSGFGNPIPKVYGSARVAGNIIWSQPIKETRHVVSSTQGGKGGGGQTTTQTTYTYSVDIAFAVAEGPIGTIRTIWADGRKIFTKSSTATMSQVIRSQNLASKVTVYDGSETQLADPLMESFEGVGNVSAHRGMGFIVFEGFQLADYGNRIPNMEFEVTVTQPSYSTSVLTNEPFDFSDTGIWAGNPWWQQGNIDQNGTLDFYMAGATTGTSELKIKRWRSVNGKIFAPPDLLTYNISPRVFDFTLNSQLVGISRALRTSGVAAFGYAQTGAPPYFLSGSSFDSSSDRLFVDLNSGSVTIIKYDQFDDDYSDSVWAMTRWNNHLYFISERGQIPNERWVLYVDLDQAAAGEVTPTKLVQDSGGAPVDILSIGADAVGWYYVNQNDDLIYYYPHGSSTPTGTLFPDPAKHLNGGSAPEYQQVWRTSANPIEFIGAKVFSSGDNLIQRVFADGSFLQYGALSIVNSGTNARSMAFGSNIAFAEDWSTSGDKVFSVLGESAAAGTELLSVIASDLSLAGGLVAGNIDVTALTDVVKGYIRTEPMTARAALEPLMLAFQFDGVESDGKIKFVKRGAASTKSIPAIDLGAAEDDKSVDEIITTRRQELELSKRIQVQHIDQTKDYQIGQQYASRINTTSVNTRDIQLPIVLSVSEARQIADKILWSEWIARTSAKLPLAMKYLELEPTDIITVTDSNGTIYELRVVDINFAYPGLLELDTLTEDASAYNSNATSSEAQAAIDTLSLPGPAKFEVLDIPMLRDIDNNAGFYAGMRGYSPTYTGGILYDSPAGEVFSQRQDFLIETTAGVSTTILAAPEDINWTWDLVSTVTIELYSGELQSDSEDALLGGANAALLGDEIIQWVNATLVATNTYTLDTLLRGRRGTEFAVGTHTDEDRFVLLDINQLQRISNDVADLGQIQYFKAVTFGTLLSLAETLQVVNTGNALKPYSPVHVEGSRDGSDNLTITWTRRSRIGAQMLWTPALGEDSESYEVDVMSGTTVLRTIAIAAETASYTAAQQTTDGLTPGDPVEVNIYQLSATVGRGTPENITV